jgi:hypothetical protein
MDSLIQGCEKETEGKKRDGGTTSEAQSENTEVKKFE